MSILPLPMYQNLYKIKDEYIKQPWYTDSPFKFIEIHLERHIRQFGTDCTWVNFKTGETFNCWDMCMRKLSDVETKKIIREFNLEKLGI